MCSGKLPERGRGRPTDREPPTADNLLDPRPVGDDESGDDDWAPPELAGHRLPSFEWMDSEDDEPQPEPGDFWLPDLDVDDEHH